MRVPESERVIKNGRIFQDRTSTEVARNEKLGVLLDLASNWASAH